MDRLSLHGIDVWAHHGVLPAERELGQRFAIDVDLWLDCAAAAASDDLARAVDYAAVHQCVVATAGGAVRHLLEAVAGDLCRALLTGFPVQRVAVTVAKVQPPVSGFAGTAAVTLERSRAWLVGAEQTEPPV